MRISDWSSDVCSSDPGRRDAVHSLPGYHGWYVALWTLVPAGIFLAVWANVAPGLVTQDVLGSTAAQALPADDFSRSAILGEARAIATGMQEIGRASCRERVCRYV